MITINQYFAGGVIIALYLFGYYFGKEVGYGSGYMRGYRNGRYLKHNLHEREMGEVRDDY